MDVSEEDLQDEFSTFGVNFDGEEIVEKLLQLCQTYR